MSKSKAQQGKENYIASQYRLIDPWTPLVGGLPSHLEQVKPGCSQYRRSAQPEQTSQNKLSHGVSQGKLGIVTKRPKQGKRDRERLTNSTVTTCV